MDPFDLRQWKGFSAAGGSLNEPAIVSEITIDSRRIESRASLFVALKGELNDGHRFVCHASEMGAKFAIVSQNWAPPQTLAPTLTLLRVADPLKAFQEIAATYRSLLKAKILAITGSFGKTMVKDLLYHFLNQERKVQASPESFNSQIGVAMSLLRISREDEIGIIEAAISLPGEMQALAAMIQPDYTLLTPVGKKHLATMNDLSLLMQEMMQLVLATSKEGWALLPGQMEVKALLSRTQLPCFFWDQAGQSLPHASPLQKDPLSGYLVQFPDASSYFGKIDLGHAYLFNLLNMAIKAAWLLGCNTALISSALARYLPEPSRVEIWHSLKKSIIVNETYCADPQSLDRALLHFQHLSTEGRKIFVFGGLKEDQKISDGAYKRVAKAIEQASIDQLYLIGFKNYKPLIDELKTHSPSLFFKFFETYEEAFPLIEKESRENDIILFQGEKKLSFDLLTEVFCGSIANNQCFINLAAIQENLALIRKHLTHRPRLMVMVKAMAYGTDEVRISQFLFRQGVDILGVSYVDEGVRLRLAGIDQAIFSLNAAPYEVKKVALFNLEVGVSDASLIKALQEQARLHQKKIKVHLHVDTGMGRFGCRAEDALPLAALIEASSWLDFEGIMTHFASAENPVQDDFTLHQIKLFDQVIKAIESAGMRPKWRHAANSSGSIRFSLSQYNMVRLGLAPYGLSASKEVQKNLELRPAISLISRIVGINCCKKGESIGYGRRYVIEKEEQKIAVLPIGYFDGIHRHYSEKAHVIIRGCLAPMVGTICMDHMMVDITNIADVQIGDKVLVFGEDEYGFSLPAEELAERGHSIVHELMTALGPRIPRVFVYEEKE